MTLHYTKTKRINKAEKEGVAFDAFDVDNNHDVSAKCQKRFKVRLCGAGLCRLC